MAGSETEEASNSMGIDEDPTSGGNDLISSDQDSSSVPNQDQEDDGDVDTDQEEEDFYETEINDTPPRDLATNIGDYVELKVFSQLPAETLTGIKPVSFQWNHRFSNPFFKHHQCTFDRSLSGFFFHSAFGSPAFASFGPDEHSLPDPSLSFFPEPVRVQSSTHGLLCCLGHETLNYYVCNPLTSDWTMLLPSLDRGNYISAQILMKGNQTFNFACDYYIVCVFELFDGIYAVHTFSSEDWAWKRFNEIISTERFLPDSGVSADQWAYWRTSRPSIVGYHPGMDTWTELALPVSGDLGTSCWQIGELMGSLCCVVVRDGPHGGSAEVVVLGEDGEGGIWRKIGEFFIGRVVPLRTQGDEEVVVWDNSAEEVVARAVEGGRRRVLVDPVPGHCSDFLPFVSSLVDVKRWQKEQDDSVVSDSDYEKDINYIYSG